MQDDLHMLESLTQPSSSLDLTSLEHPYLFFTGKDIPLLRTKARDSEITQFGFSTQAAWEQIKKRADVLLTAAPYHYEVTLSDGLWSYTMSSDPPPPHPKSPNFPAWTAMFQERSDSITTRIKFLSFAHIITGDTAYANAAKTIVLQLSNWPRWTDLSYPAGAAALDTAHATQTVATFYDWAYTILTRAEKDLIRTALINKGIVPIVEKIPDVEPDHNFWALLTSGLGIAALAVIKDDARAEGWQRQAIANMKLGLDAQGGDGGTIEGFLYGTYFADYLARLLDVLSSARIPNNVVAHHFYQRLPAFAINFLSPLNYFQPNIGDAFFSRGFPQTMQILAQNGNDYATWYLRQIGFLSVNKVGVTLFEERIGEPHNFIRFDPAHLNVREPDWHPSSVFQAIGYGVLRDGFEGPSPYLTFKSGPRDKEIVHNHFDHNSFVINYLGQWLATDPGYQDFFNEARGRFTCGTIGHNSILVDGKDQSTKSGGLISDFFSAESYEFIKGKAGAAYNPPLEKFDRSIVFVKPHYFVIYDELAAPTPHVYTYLLHTDNSAIIEERPDGALIKKGGAQLRGWVFSVGELKQSITSSPGAETYGRYLKANTRSLTKASILSVLYPQTNSDLLLNPDFELDMVGWLPRCTSQHAIDTAEFHSGTRSGKIWFEKDETCSKTQDGYFYSNRFVLPPGSPITAKGYIKTAVQAGNGARIRILYWKNNDYLSDAAVPYTKAETWTLFTIDSTVPPEADEISVALEFKGTGTAWFDTISVESPAIPLPPAEPEVIPLAEGQDGVVVSTADRCEIMLFNPEKAVRRFTVGARRAVTDGQIAVISRHQNGKLLSLTLQHGTVLSLHRRLLLHSSCRGATSVQFQGAVLHISAAEDTRYPGNLHLCGKLTIFAPHKVTAVIVNGKSTDWERRGEYIVVT